MSFCLLPKEIRFRIYLNMYLDEPVRLVSLRTKPHDENHDENYFCPRYSPSPAPLVTNICSEAREEVKHQAKLRGQLIQLPIGDPSIENPHLSKPFFLRFDKDILYLQLDDAHTSHHDDFPDNGMLPHFRQAVGCDPSALREIAITKVVWSGYRDGSFSNSLRDFPNIQRMIMTVPIEARADPAKKIMFVRAARRIVTLYKFDIRMQKGDHAGPLAVDVDFATINQGRLETMSKGKWKDWSDMGIDWVERDSPSSFYESMSW